MGVTLDPMGESRFHKVLVFTDNLQKLPPFVLVVTIIFCAALIALAWGGNRMVVFTYLLAGGINWLTLWLLPRFGLSYGPDRPSALALALLMMALLVPLGWLNASPLIAVLVLILITAAAIYSTWIEPFNLQVAHQILNSPHWTSPEPLRLLHIGDIHIERVTPRERRLNRLITELKPDIIVFSGDFVNLSYTYDPQTFQAIREIISEWRAPMGVYCVPGTYTVEPVERVREFVAGLDNLCLMLDQWETTADGRFHIMGMVTRHILDTDQQTFRHLMQSAPENGFKLLLTHAPDVAFDADASGIDLYLCGHTHGGQIRMPLIGAIFSGSHLGMRFVMGRHDLTQTTVYTTRGVGLEGLGAPRARFLCPPEIILWQIKGVSS